MLAFAFYVGGNNTSQFKMTNEIIYSKPMNNWKLALLLFCSTLIATVEAKEVNVFNSIKSCSNKLPAGYQYQLSLKTNIDTTEVRDELVWDIKMTDESKAELPDSEDDRRDKEIEPFIECIWPLLN